jgi:putative transposase
MYYFDFDTIYNNNNDQVHFFVVAELIYLLPRVMQIIKSITARKIFKEYS